MKKIIFEDSFLVSEIMCFLGCGESINNLLQANLAELIDNNQLPKDAQLLLSAEPEDRGLHRYFLYIESEQEFAIAEKQRYLIKEKLRENINLAQATSEVTSFSTLGNKYNIIINILAISLITLLHLIFPPSLLLTITLLSISFFATTFTAREYLRGFWQNLKRLHFLTMNTTVSLGWFLALGHSLFHAFSMPLLSSFSMIFMGLLMPIILMLGINLMDELKGLFLRKSVQYRLNGISSLFPQLARTYRCHPLNFAQQFKKMYEADKETLVRQNQQDPAFFSSHTEDRIEVDRHLLQEGMLIEVENNQCFPTDCLLIREQTLVDASLLTGEIQQTKQQLEEIPAGAINLGPKVLVYALRNYYSSTINQLLFVANRAKKTTTAEDVSPVRFGYLYGGLLILGFIAAIMVPIAFGTASFALLSQNILGLLFSVCPCTLAIGYQFPNLLNLLHHHKKGILLGDESLCQRQDEIHTLVVDKTGTLTTGNSIVYSTDIDHASPLWEKIYLLENTYGNGHPLAKAIINFYQQLNRKTTPLFTDIHDFQKDSSHRGISARVQGKLIHLGNERYIRSLVGNMPEINGKNTRDGLTAVYVAEENIYRGVIYIKHEVRPGIIEALRRLKNEGKKIMMLTGDTLASAKGFNRQINSLFSEEEICADQTPQEKDIFLKNKMSTVNPKGFWFIGDGLNDAPSCRRVDDLGGVSCSPTAQDKSSFFSPVVLNNSLDYLFSFQKINHFLRRCILQNQAISVYTTIALLAFILCFSIAGLSLPPVIPLIIMLSTTLTVFFNSYRIQLVIDLCYDKNKSWLKKLFASNFSIGLLLVFSSLLIGSLLVSTLVTSTLAFPLFSFTAGLALFCSITNLTALSGLAVLSFLFLTHISQEWLIAPSNDSTRINQRNESIISEPRVAPVNPEAEFRFQLLFNKQTDFNPQQPPMSPSFSQNDTI